MDDQQASLQFRTTRDFTLMDGSRVETQIEDRLHGCLIMSSGKIQALMRKTRRNMGRIAELHVIDISSLAGQPTEFHTRREHTA
jgi:hypothetical protein